MKKRVLTTKFTKLSLGCMYGNPSCFFRHSSSTNLLFLIITFFSIPNIAIYMRQVLGPVFVIYNIKSLVVELQKSDENLDIFKRILIFLAFFTSFVAGCFLRPDNDWAQIQHIIPIRAKILHALLMIISTFCNVLLVIYCYISI